MFFSYIIQIINKGLCPYTDVGYIIGLLTFSLDSSDYLIEQAVCSGTFMMIKNRHDITNLFMLAKPITVHAQGPYSEWVPTEVVNLFIIFSVRLFPNQTLHCTTIFYDL